MPDFPIGSSINFWTPTLFLSNLNDAATSNWRGQQGKMHSRDRRVLEVKVWVLILTAGLLTGWSAPANALELCAILDKKTGELKEGSPIKLRSVCKTKKNGTPIEVSIGTTEGLAAAAANTAATAANTAAREDLAKYVEVDTTNHVVRFTGANVQIRSGAGASWGTGDDDSPDVNGLGNLIIGYDEDDENDKSGSHNLVLGPYHTYSQAGGLVAGFNNTASGSYASVTGGSGNIASESRSSITGGRSNEASGTDASVSGGFLNKATADRSSASGGRENQALNTFAWTGGGYRNKASGLYSVVSGGSTNDASGIYASISGGGNNEASGGSSSVNGGYLNETSGAGSSISGGYNNQTTANYSVVSGGIANTSNGRNATVTGGKLNVADLDDSVLP